MSTQMAYLAIDEQWDDQLVRQLIYLPNCIEGSPVDPLPKKEQRSDKTSSFL